MKKGFLAIVKAILYFGVYFGTQILVSVVFMVAMSAQMTAELVAAGEELDMVAMMEQLTVAVMDKAMLITFVSGIATLLVYWIIFLIRKKNMLHEAGIASVPVNGIAPIVIMAIGFNVVTSVLVSAIPWPQEWMDAYMESSSIIDTSAMAWITAVFMAPVLEEIVFRGFVYTRLKKGLPVIVAAVITSLAFGMMHGTLIWLIYTFIFGMLLVWIRERFQSLTACILLHMGYNFAGMLLSLIPEEAGIVIWILFAASIVVIVLSYRKIKELTENVANVDEIAESVEI